MIRISLAAEVLASMNAAVKSAQDEYMSARRLRRPSQVGVVICATLAGIGAVGSLAAAAPGDGYRRWPAWETTIIRTTGAKDTLSAITDGAELES